MHLSVASPGRSIFQLDTHYWVLFPNLAAAFLCVHPTRYVVPGDFLDRKVVTPSLKMVGESYLKNGSQGHRADRAWCALVRHHDFQLSSLNLCAFLCRIFSNDIPTFSLYHQKIDFQPYYHLCL